MSFSFFYVNIFSFLGENKKTPHGQFLTMRRGTLVLAVPLMLQGCPSLPLCRRNAAARTPLPSPALGDRGIGSEVMGGRGDLPHARTKCMLSVGVCLAPSSSLPLICFRTELVYHIFAVLSMSFGEVI